jgi:hypothetical protein
LFDLPYFLQLSQAGDFVAPSLQSVGDDADRQKAMCASSICNAFIENNASALVAQLPVSPETETASNFIRTTVSRMRCGCAVRTKACASTKEKELLITDTSGVKSFIEATTCDDKGALMACARTWVNCENVPLPACARTCTQGNLASIKFRVKNLDWQCLQTKLTTTTFQTIREDVIANVPGLLHTDFGCECDAATAPKTGTECTCNVTCNALSAVRNLDLSGTLSIFEKHVAAVVIPTPTLDKIASVCRITPGITSFGDSFELISLETNFPSDKTSASSTLVLGLSVVASLCISLVL